jgi:hypothetical protein
MYKMAQIQVFDSATTRAGAGAEMFDRPATVGELRQAIADAKGLLINDFFLNAAGRMLEDDAGLDGVEYVTIMHRSPAEGGPAESEEESVPTEGGRRRRRSTRRRRNGARKSRRNNMAGGRRRRGSRKSRKSRRAHRRHR